MGVTRAIRTASNSSIAHLAMAAFEGLFGDTILTKDGEKPTKEVLADKDYVMVYFSAHWCPPCRGYTPQLTEAYTKSEKKEKVAVVFVSSDRDQGAFDEYYGEMSFFALPFSKRDEKQKLSEKYDVKGIPTLVLLDGAGECKEGNIRGKHGEYL